MRHKLLTISLTTTALCSATAVFADYGYYHRDGKYQNIQGANSNTFVLNKDVKPSLATTLGNMRSHNKDEYPYARAGDDYYLFANYTYSYNFNDKADQIIQNKNPNISSVVVSPASSLPDQFHGVEAGFGHQCGKHFDLEIAYIQNIKNTRKSAIAAQGGLPVSGSSASLETKGAAVNLAYIFNPKEQFQTAFELGAKIENFRELVTQSSNNYELTSTEINPTAALEFIFQLSAQLAIRAKAEYTYHPTNPYASGQIAGAVGFSCIL